MGGAKGARGMSRRKWVDRVLWLTAGVGIGFFIVPVALVRLHSAGGRLASNPDPMVAMLFGWRKEDSAEHEGFAVVSGGVKNISEETLQGVTVIVTFWSAAGNEIGSYQVEPKKRSLRPGDDTHWELKVRWKGVMTGGGPTVRFEDGSGRELPYVEGWP
jgi:hypothetical protein